VSVVLQLNVKTCLEYGAIVFTWIFVPVYLTTIGSLGTDIIKGTCVPWGAYSSYAAEKAMVSSVFLLTYLLPLIMMVFLYFRIVYALRYKVSHVMITVHITGSALALGMYRIFLLQIQPKC